MNTSNPVPPRGDATREAIIRVALAAFAEHGYDKVGLRALADEAGVNQALINYHFGNKRGLYLAVFSEIAARIRARLDPLMDAVDAALAKPASRDREADYRDLFTLIDNLLSLMTAEASDTWARAIVREQQRPTEAFDVLYAGFMDRLLGLLARLIGRIRGDGDEEDNRLLALTIIGQVVMFRIARAGVLRTMAWPALDAAGIESIRTRIHRNVTAILEA